MLNTMTYHDLSLVPNIPQDIDQLWDGKVRKSDIASCHFANSSVSFHQVLPATTNSKGILGHFELLKRTNQLSWVKNTNFGFEWQKHQPRLSGYSFRRKAALHFLVSALPDEMKLISWFQQFQQRFTKSKHCVTPSNFNF